jgi:peroxiredoxin
LPSTPSSGADRSPRRSTTKVVGLVGAIVVVIVAIAAYFVSVSGDDGENDSSSRSSGAGTSGVAEPGEEAPDFELDALAGDGTVRLSDFRGQPVILNFWASWCTPCRAEFPALQRALDEHEDEGLTVVGVTYEDFIESDARDFVEEQDATWPQAFDPDSTVGRDYGVRSPPVSFYILPDGTIHERVFGYNADTFDDHVDALLAAS